MSDFDPKTAIAAMKDVKIMVVGDVMLDRFVYGEVKRISPESPVPVLSVTRESAMLGGAGNTLANLAGLGAKGFMLAAVGDDGTGRIIREKAQALDIDTSGLLTDSSHPTTVKTRFLAGHQQLLRSDYDRSTALTPALEKQLLDHAKALISKVQAVILSDYGKGLLTDTVISGVIALAKKAGVPVIVDPKGKDFTRYKGASAVTPNKKELSEACGGAALNSDEAVIKAAQQIIDACGIEAVVATRSAEGITVVAKGAEAYHVRGKDIEVFDVSGAGDTVIATLAAALASGATLNDAALIANMAGSIAVTKVGTAPIRAEELEAALKEDKIKTGALAGICDLDHACEILARWRANGLSVGLTNGCFDILHFGHVSYLADAKARCDRLIVGLNHDKSVRILKGEDRPVHDEASRAAVLAALSAVDLVVLFGAEEEGVDNTACALVEALQPDLYFKGGDYTLDQIPEAPSVKAQGGRVVIIPAQEGHSTTNSLKKRGQAA